VAVTDIDTFDRRLVARTGFAGKSIVAEAIRRFPRDATRRDATSISCYTFGIFGPRYLDAVHTIDTNIDLAVTGARFEISGIKSVERIAIGCAKIALCALLDLNSPRYRATATATKVYRRSYAVQRSYNNLSLKRIQFKRRYSDVSRAHEALSGLRRASALLPGPIYSYVAWT